MSEPMPEFEPLDARAFLAGEGVLKPLHSSAQAWQELLPQLIGDAGPAAPELQAWHARLTPVLAHAQWPAAHDAARDAMIAAWRMVQGAEDAFSPEDVDQVERLFEVAMPRAAQVAAIEDPALRAALEPLKTYLERWAGEESVWHTIPTPPPAAASGLEHLFGAAPVPKPPTPPLSSASIPTSGIHAVWSIHDENCGFCRPLSQPSAAGGSRSRGLFNWGGGDGHVHGPDCGHVAEYNVKKPLYWVAGSAIVAAIVYFISEYGKRDRFQPLNEKEKPWTNRVGDTEINSASVLPPSP